MVFILISMTISTKVNIDIENYLFIYVSSLHLRQCVMLQLNFEKKIFFFLDFFFFFILLCIIDPVAVNRNFCINSWKFRISTDAAPWDNAIQNGSGVIAFKNEWTCNKLIILSAFEFVYFAFAETFAFVILFFF